ncbi:N-acetylmuramoyl-L-alanine amidase [Cytobacillus oceanisediminis]|uniref:N-acetylmuramoyl-L-alanine amidase family protein n=1 Tax=Cytobacillus oceanisediminis TaxID=665099 RepID=UPI00203EC052|nr:N-acetylmuramoyl-L-alanine amidase [Cytobacillus oceanisediminis]MCM3242678.1 N-acetylmuramoyl-L-alanine amidase [Cytobacillus oceanisediminis]
MTKIIEWDKGHGGIDSGAIGNGLLEKVLTHKIVEYAMAYMSANYTGFKQSATRKGDQTLSLNQRTDKANREGADVLVSVHINSLSSTSKGFETFIYNGNVGDATIAFQNLLHAEILAAMRKFGAVVDRGKKRANLHMVRESKMVACLTENLFISNVAEAKLLKNEAFLKAVGEAHARGVAKFLGLPAKKKPDVPKPIQKHASKPKEEKIVEDGVYWDGKKMARGQIGRVVILKSLPLWSPDKKKHRGLSVGDIITVYRINKTDNYKYEVGGGYTVSNVKGYVKYEQAPDDLIEANKAFYNEYK